MTAPVPSPNWVHYADVVKVIDGDTLSVRLDLGRYPHKIQTEVPIRLAAMNSPELRTEHGPAARDKLRSLTDGKRLVLQTRKPDPRDPYGRVVADAWLPDGTSLAQAMITSGFAVAYPS